jgi:hypothetical protein
MSCACSLRGSRGGAARLSSSRRGGGECILPLGAAAAVPDAIVELPRLKQPMLELASSPSTTSSSTAVGAAVAAATDLLFSSSPAPAPSLTTAEELDESDGVGVATPFAVAEAIERDFAKAYFLTGAISGEAYDRECAFVDPTVSVRGLRAWRRNIALLGKYLDSPRVELMGKVAVVGAQEGAEAEGDFARGDALVAASAASPGSPDTSEAGGTGGRHAVVARWRLIAPVSLLPWRPVVDVQGVTVYRLAGEGRAGEKMVNVERGGGGATAGDEVSKGGEGGGASSSSPPPLTSPPLRVVVDRHTEAWGTSPGAAVAQLLVPGGREGR